MLRQTLWPLWFRIVALGHIYSLSKSIIETLKKLKLKSQVNRRRAISTCLKNLCNMDAFKSCMDFKHSRILNLTVKMFFRHPSFSYESCSEITKLCIVTVIWQVSNQSQFSLYDIIMSARRKTQRSIPRCPIEYEKYKTWAGFQSIKNGHERGKL